MAKTPDEKLVDPMPNFERGRTGNPDRGEPLPGTPPIGPAPKPDNNGPDNPYGLPPGWSGK